MANETPENRGDDLLSRATEQLRKRGDDAAAASPLPPASAVEETLSRLGRASSNRPTRFQTWRSIVKKPAFQLSAAAMVFIAVSLASWMLALRPGVALADAIAEVGEVKSVSFKTSHVDAKTGAPVVSEVIISEPSRMRTAGPKQIMIMDLQARKMLMLNPVDKTGILTTFTGTPNQAAQLNILTRLKNLDTKSFETIGKKSIDGRTAVGFRRKLATPLFTQETIWVDEKTRLPLEMETKVSNAPLPDTAIVMRDFKWNVPVDETLFSLTPPADYRMTNSTINATPAVEADLIDGLRAAAELQKNVFPDRFDLSGIMGEVTLLKAKMASGKTPEGLAARDKVMPAVVRMARGIAFISPKNGSDFHYAGKGVTIDRPDRPILWYRPASSADTYRVVNADLSVRDVKASELPSIPSVLLHNSSGPATSTSAPASEGL
jgi:outer membrane lipoprotein-sorting protein